MPTIIPAKEWNNHPILSKLYSKSDFDGDSAYTIDDPTPNQRDFLLNLTLEYRKPGQDWEASPFHETATFWDGSRMAWYHPYLYHPMFEIVDELKGQHTPEWRAVVG